MSDALFDLPGEAGKRVERVEWALRHPKDHPLWPGAISERESEEHARATSDRWEYGTAGTVVVSRTVVTYTTRWTPS